MTIRRRFVLRALPFAMAMVLPSAAFANGDCPDGYHQQGEQDEHAGNRTITHAICAPDEDAQTPAAAPAITCAAASQRAVVLRNAIDQQRGLERANQEQLDEWTRRGIAGRNQLVKDSVKLVLGAYAADSEVVQEEAAKLEKVARIYSTRALGPSYNASRMADLAEFKRITGELRPLNRLVRSKAILNADNITAWDVSRDSMHNGFAIAAKSNDAFGKLVESSRFREDLLGPVDEDPQRALLETAISETSQLVAKRALGLARFESMTGPTVRVVDFVFNAALDDLGIYLSADRVDQASTNAGDLAQKAGVVQNEYKRVVDRLRQCRSQ